MTPAGQLLLDCLHHAPDRLTTERIAREPAAVWRSLLEAAREQRVRPLVERRLLRDDVRAALPPEVLTALSDATHEVARRNLAMHAELGRLLRALAAGGITPIVLKGAHLASAVYGNLALREMGDLDLLIRREHLAEATGLARAAGYASPKPLDVRLEAEVRHHVGPLIGPHGLLLELHWNVTEPHQPYTIDPSGLWERAERATQPGLTTLALGTEDLLLHLCQHVSYHHRFEFGIRSLCDIAELTHHPGIQIQWEAVFERARQWGWQRGVDLALGLARDMLGAKLPSGRLDAMPIEVASGVFAAARVQLMAPPNGPDFFGRRVAGIAAPGVASKARYLMRMIRRPATELQREYPAVPRSLWTWWVVYALRCRDLARRHAGMFFRLLVRRDRAIQSALQRQYVVWTYLIEPSGTTTFMRRHAGRRR